jgi:RecB family exonuclease
VGNWARSPSQLSLYERCARAFEFKYVKRYNLAASWAVKGRAQHRALEHSFRQKLESGVDAPAAEVVAVFHEEVRHAFSPMATEEVVLFEGESEERIRRDGEAGLRVYLGKIAPMIQPLMVEESLECTLPSGLRLRGRIDLIDDQFRIRDAKFPTDAMDAATLHYQWQPPVYGALVHARLGRYPQFVYDVVRTGRGKVPAPVAQPPLPVQVTEALVTARLADLEAVDAQIQAGHFPRRPSAMNCSRCVYKHACWSGVLPPAAEAPESDLTGVLQASVDAVSSP